MKKLFVVQIIILNILFFSCKSNAIFVPGEKKVKIQNIYKEYFNLAEEYFNLEKYDKAAEFYLKASSSKELYNVAYYKTARCYAFNKQYDKAEAIYKRFIKKDPDNLTIQSSLAYLTAMKGNTKKACLLYKDLVHDNPDNSDFLINYVSVLIMNKDYETAKINLEYIEEKFPDVTQLTTLKEKLAELEEAKATSSDTEKEPETNDELQETETSDIEKKSTSD